MTNRHGFGEKISVLAKSRPDTTNGIPTADAEARNGWFWEDIRLETEQKAGFMAASLVVEVVSPEDGLYASQLAKICEKMSETHLGARHMVREPNCGVKRNHGTMDVADGRMFKNVLTMY